uniref:ANF_receptor domain-containing protein n=1 Tax=Strongyloides venezuelensis TaxID=75913 RepID=A0A0K0F4J5_STRVS
MLSKILIVLLLLFTIFVNSNAQVAYATDVVGFLTPSQFSCIKYSGYDAVFTQIYSPMDGGSVDIYGTKNIITAYEAGLSTEVYINPAPQSNKLGDTQFDEAYKQLTNAHIHVRSIWLKVTKPLLWHQNVSYNVNFIRDMLNRAQSYNVNFGIYTNWYDWDQITGSTAVFQQDNLPLWYWNAQGFGPNAESLYHFGDFTQFGIVTLALNQIKNEKILPDYKYTFSNFYDVCHVPRTSFGAYELIEKYNVDVIFGSTCNIAAMRLSIMAKFYSVLTFVWGAVSTSDVTNLNRLPNIFSTYAIFFLLGLATIDVLNISIGQLCQKIYIDFDRVLNYTNSHVQIVQSYKTTFDPTYEEFGKFLNKISNKTRVILSCFDDDMYKRKFLISMFDNGLNNDE